MDEEYLTLITSNTWELSKVQKGSKVIGTKWVFKVKTDEKGNMACHKARLVALGYNQRQRID